MAEVKTRECDECNKIMTPGEKWYAMAFHDGVIIIVPMTERERIFQLVSCAPGNVLDLCSLDCLAKRVVKK